MQAKVQLRIFHKKYKVIQILVVQKAKKQIKGIEKLAKYPNFHCKGPKIDQTKVLKHQ